MENPQDKPTTTSHSIAKSHPYVRGICIHKILISNLALNSKHELNQIKLWTNITLTTCPRKHEDEPYKLKKTRNKLNNFISPILRILVARAVHREANFTIRQSLKHYDHTAQLSTETMNKIWDWMLTEIHTVPERWTDQLTNHKILCLKHNEEVLFGPPLFTSMASVVCLQIYLVNAAQVLVKLHTQWGWQPLTIHLTHTHKRSTMMEDLWNLEATVIL
jgi:hypothetical protein